VTTTHLVIVGVLAVIAYVTRITMIMLLGRLHMSRRLDAVLKLTVPAVFSAIVAPNIVTHQGALAIALSNPRPAAALIALLVALKTRSMTWTIVSGLLVFWVWQWAAG
jgi:branched-subunit amino acid transport protein